ncbi:MAG: cyclic nucleotide-binding domain-containing protein [Mariprofundaceae bacterium]|nr:cyclic nucleotide-binding domain-containing protein [Mariprofundaceae bacterium]
MQDFQKIFQRARDAAAKGDFQMARKLYSELWQSPTWKHDTDVQLSYAYSCERTGDYTEALQAYKALMGSSVNRPNLAGEQDVAEESMTRLRELMGDVGESEDNAVIDVNRDAAEAAFVTRLFTHGYSRSLLPGDVLCHEGEPAGHMWLLQDGTIDAVLPHQVTSKLTGAENRPCLMGELAYFTGLRRSATLCCATAVKVIELPYEDIRALLEKDKSLYEMMDYLFRHRLVAHILSRHQIFKLFNEPDRKRLTSVFENTLTKSGQMLIEQGEDHPHAYMVQSGVLLLLDCSQGEEQLLGSVQPGDFFHLGGLLRGHHAAYKVLSGTPSHLLRLPRHDFEPFMLQRPWLIGAILKHVRLSSREQVLRPDAGNVWGADNYIDMK